MLRRFINNTLVLRRSDSSPLTPFIRTFSSNSRPNHSAFEGVQQSGNIADHSNFNGPTQGIPVPDINLGKENISDALKQDAVNKHKQAAETGDFVMEIQARVEQSVADRLRNHDKPNHGIPSPRNYDEEDASLAYKLKRDAAQKQSLGDRLHDEGLRAEARIEQSLADSMLYESQHKPQSQPQQSQVNNQIEFHVGNKTFHTPQELQMDAAQKQIIANKTHDQALMEEARLEQKVADALLPNQQHDVEDESYDIFEELSIELSDFPPVDLTESSTTDSKQL